LGLGNSVEGETALTRPLKKKRERFFVEEAARFLGKTWYLGGNREHPDFVVTDGGQQFGLEVCEIFMGPQGYAGSAMKAKESAKQRSVNALRLEYEAIVNSPLTVKFVGDMSADNLATVVPALVAQDLSSKPTGHQVVLDSGNGLRVHVTKAFRPDWYSVNDRVGFVDRNPQNIIADAIEKKAKELTRYMDTAGSDIRLLLVADRIQNSGKLILEEQVAFDFNGFHAVYFFPYPESVIMLGDAAPQGRRRDCPRERGRGEDPRRQAEAKKPRDS
jgi:hypothetical protein